MNVFYDAFIEDLMTGCKTQEQEKIEKLYPNRPKCCLGCSDYMPKNLRMGWCRAKYGCGALPGNYGLVMGIEPPPDWCPL